ncbi:MAG: DUF11 domain-containing protein [Acidobacteria bacterium]|nr:DUF11 domain-containing protein [Acidobacteriota bacterium]
MKPPLADFFTDSLVQGPAAAASFQALSDNNFAVPPDTMGAAGPNHLMVVSNTQIRIQSRPSGSTLSLVSVSSFWSSVLPPGSTGVFDPHLSYDPYWSRWIFAVVSDAEGGNSSLCIAVSQTADPTGIWNLFRLDADATNTLWADYPTLGFNRDWIVVSVNMFTIGSDFFQRVQVYALNKENLYANSIAGLFVYDVAGIFTLVPAITYDNSISTVHMVRHVSSASGIIRKSALVGSPPSAPTLQIDTATIQSTLGPWSVPPGDFLPQLGTSRKIDGGDERIQSVVVRTVGSETTLWCAQNIVLPAGGAPNRAAVQWWQLKSGISSTQVLQQGRIEDPAATQTNAGHHYAYPGIAVNGNGDMLIGASRFSAAEFAGAAYSFRSAVDPPNTLREATLLKAGEGPYEKTFGGFFNRWGDYSNSAVDPVNDIDFWTIQEYAAAPSGGFDRWGLWWGQIVPTAGPDLMLAKTHSGNFKRGAGGVYTLAVSNAGTAASSGAVTITDSLPAGLSFASASGGDWTCSASGQTITCVSSMSLQPGTTGAALSLTVNVGASAAETVTNNASVSNPSDVNNSNNSASDVTTIVSVPEAPGALAAVACFGAEIQVTWKDNSSDETGFKLERKTGAGGSFVLIKTLAANATSYLDTGLSSSTSYVYRVSATNAAGDSAYSNEATATTPATPVFTDDQLIAGVTKVRAIHVVELRQAVNAVRACAGLAAAAWTDTSLVGVLVKAIHIQELRDQLNAALTPLGKPLPAYTDDPLVAGVTPIKKAHVKELRQAVQ